MRDTPPAGQGDDAVALIEPAKVRGLAVMSPSSEGLAYSSSQALKLGFRFSRKAATPSRESG